MSKLIDERPLLILPSLAKAIGLNEAVVLQQLHFRLQISRERRRGKPWHIRTVKEWTEEEFPFWSEQTVERIFDNLEARNLIERSNIWNTKGWDRTKWYTINYEVFYELVDGLEQERLIKLISPSDQSDQFLLEEVVKEKEEEVVSSSSFLESDSSQIAPARIEGLIGDMSVQAIWESAFGQLALTMPREAFDTWVRHMRPRSYADGCFTIQVNSQYAQQWLESRLKRVIVRTLSQIAGQAVDVEFVL